MIEIKVKKNKKWAKIPIQAYTDDLGYDLVGKLIEIRKLECGYFLAWNTGIIVNLPNNFGAFIKPRSGLSQKYAYQILAGVIDPGYRGEIAVLTWFPEKPPFEIGDVVKIAQLVFIPKQSFIFEEGNVEQTERNQKGFGSSDKR